MTMLDTMGTLLTAALALAGVLGAIVLLGRALRHTPLARTTGGTRTLAIKETLALDSRRRLHAIEAGGKTVLLLTGGETDLVVGWLDRGPGA